MGSGEGKQYRGKSGGEIINKTENVLKLIRNHVVLCLPKIT